MLSGFTVPKLPLGQPGLTPPSQWNYSNDVVGIREDHTRE
jgi:hypothetical protein